MQIESGLFDHMVLQRTAANTCHAQLTGSGDRDGTVVAFVTDAEGEPLDDFLNAEVGEIRDGNLTATLQGLPCGGPYEIQLSIATRTGKQLDSVVIRDVLVGDVWLLAGQSNMQGVGLLQDRPQPHDQVRAFYMDDRWDVAEEPVHNMYAAVDAVHEKLCGGALPPKNVHTGVGPGHTFGLALRANRGVPQGLIACAHGGTSMSQWDPGTPDDTGASLYGALLRRYRKNGSSVAGMIWYQGESDAGPGVAEHYTDRMVNLISALRRDTQQPELPVCIVQLSRVVGPAGDRARAWNSIQDQQRLLPRQIDHLLTVPAIDLALDDGIHVSARGMRRLGRRLALAMEHLTNGDSQPPIELAEITVSDDPRGMAIVDARFENVVGGLQAAGRPWGFSIGNDEDKNGVWDVQVEGDTVRIGTNLSSLDAQLEWLGYGKGLNPYCNITDEADRSLPVFGPVRIGQARAITDAVRSFRISPLQPPPQGIDTLSPPADNTSQWESRTFPADYAHRLPELADQPDLRALGWYATTIDCPETMPLTLLLGYDGPVKVWLDGEVAYIDPEGLPPCNPVKAFISLHASAGKHQLLIALANCRPHAFGIYLRLERRDISPEQAEAGDILLPTFDT